ncbi:LLM class flavin-dependent oxidoreductase [Paenibacillus sp. HWE-109]|uniref:LLM class flavin-dependent oxidoreductase n=1 Tax=Paenibacillus sp. HWE-109 TaxID=1306526 RepID=UPI001EE0DCA0|nr:LLM class flavin-dependent oxidoreductase [Paenibacillus sp. HWE-109]UKS24719.1 LLM class flavin-dependent oxidoreductase [Paenibacillus sp. HWE-109]
MSHQHKQMILNFFLNNTGVHEMGWKHPEAQPERVSDLSHYIELVQIAEAAKFHAVFLADNLSLGPLVATNGLSTGFEPVTLLAALAAVTSRIGLIATVSSTYTEPFNTARLFASLDHLSGGRAGWNVVTSANSLSTQLNFQQEESITHEVYYNRAEEFVQLAKKFWDSWEDDALVLDREKGIYADQDKIHTFDHHGPYYDAKGPLNLPRSPQGYPVLVQAGASETGKNFAARTAEVVYTMQPAWETAQAFYRDIKSRVEKFGRNPDELKIIPGICPVIGETEEEAKEKAAKIHKLLDVRVGVKRISLAIDYDLSAFPLDEPVPDLSGIPNQKTYSKLIQTIARNEQLTIRQLVHRVASGNGHLTFVGTPVQIADELEAWFLKAADGFAIRPQLSPGGLADFAKWVVPELQRRGLFHKEYTGRTLRENLGLKRPVNSFIKQFSG